MIVTIQSVAVLYGGVIFSMPRPNRHFNVLHAMCEMGLPNSSHEVQGFLTSEGRFVTRLEAMAIATNAEQVITKDPLKILFSEDLW